MHLSPLFANAAVTALWFPLKCCDQLRADYARRRATILDVLRAAGFECYAPEGAYYGMTDFTALTMWNLPDALLLRFARAPHSVLFHR